MAEEGPEYALDTFSANTRKETSSMLSKTDQPTKRKSTLLQWSRETAAMLGSYIFLGAIIGVLKYMENKPLKTWGVPLSLNTAISILSTLGGVLMSYSIAACLGQLKWIYFQRRTRPLQHFDLFDSAATDPIASLVLFWKVPWGAAYLAAVVSVLAIMAFGPAIQQLIEIEQEDSIIPSSSGLLGYNHNYSSSSQENANGNANGIVDIDSLDLGMHAAIVSGLNGMPVDEPVSCSSNCTWENPVISLGFASLCTDVTETTLSTKTCAKTGVVHTCTMKSPGGLTFNMSFVETDWSSSVVVTTSQLFTTAYTTWPQPEGNKVAPEYLRVLVWRRPIASMDIEEEVVECDLRIAAWRYTNASLVNREFHRDAVEVPLSQGRFFEEELIRRFKFVSYDLIEGEETTAIVPNNNSLTLRSTDIIAINDLLGLDPVFTGTTFVGNRPDSRPGLRSALMRGNISQVFANMSESMTNYVRRSAGSNNTIGTTTENISFVKVRWAWLTVPLFTLLAQTVLMVITMVMNSRSKLPILKSSLLPLLFLQTDGEGNLISELPSLDMAMDKSETMKVKLT